MMQDENCKTHSIPNSSGHNTDKDERELETEDISSDSESTPSTSKYSSNVLSKKLRCVKLNWLFIVIFLYAIVFILHDYWSMNFILQQIIRLIF